MHFRSRTSAAAGESAVLQTAGSAASYVVGAIVCPSGMQTEQHGAVGGDLAFSESKLRVTGLQEFQENGSIAFGDESEHLLRFSTVGQGRHVATGPACVLHAALTTISESAPLRYGAPDIGFDRRV
jgi:hypothetical protein